MEQPTAPVPASATSATPRLVGYDAAALHLGVKVGTLRAWVSRQQIPHYRLGARMVRFDLDALDRWLATKAARLA